MKTILILCDGGGSNNARSWQFKWWLIKLAKRLGVNIRIAHYPPYSSKWNPIEHMLFSQISRAWSGAVFNTIEEACELHPEQEPKRDSPFSHLSTEEFMRQRKSATRCLKASVRGIS